MKRISASSIFHVLITGFFLTIIFSCEKEIDPKLLPVLTTTEITAISALTAQCGGIITCDGGYEILSRGVCWNTSLNPTIDNTKTTDGAGIGTFKSNIKGLQPTTTYYARAYATNKNGVAYGHQVAFTTEAMVIPTNLTSLIPAGTFNMGSPLSEIERDESETQHTVNLSAFRICKYEITNKQYADFLNTKSIGSNALYEAGTDPTQVLIYASNSYGVYGTNVYHDWGLHYTNGHWMPVVGFEYHPVINVTWYGANEFAIYAGGTLPTEAQWEYACRAGTTTPFHTGNFLSNLQANYYWAAAYNGGTNSVTTDPGKTQTIGTYPANSWGLFDMHGNVWEWCSDWYGNNTMTAQTNPTGAAQGMHRVTRGGGWGYRASSCRSAVRNDRSPNAYQDAIGFRVVFVP